MQAPGGRIPCATAIYSHCETNACSALNIYPEPFDSKSRCYTEHTHGLQWFKPAPRALHLFAGLSFTLSVGNAVATTQKQQDKSGGGVNKIEKQT